MQNEENDHLNEVGRSQLTNATFCNVGFLIKKLAAQNVSLSSL